MPGRLKNKARLGSSKSEFDRNARLHKRSVTTSMKIVETTESGRAGGLRF